MTSVVYTADDGYCFPTGYSVTSENGISVNRDSGSQITVSGTPTATTTITLTAATEKASQNGINYKVNVTVNEEVINPQTGIKKVSIILVIIVSLLYIINSFVIKKMKFKKI
ncbi:MAG TPA: hypothetical protein PLC25_05290 [Bacilli bacterium]|nr:hypothetical protein [Bacilli bacterium]